MNSLVGKKLLIIGSSEVDTAIVQAAKSMGIYTICCDGNMDPVHTPAKVIADEAWNINYADTEEVAKMCLSNNVDGVMAGYSEWRVLAASKIAKAIERPFYATEGQIELTRNKRSFKDQCLKYGVPVPKDYSFTLPLTKEQKNTIEFPVIVKPVDNGGRKGVTVCHDMNALDDAIKKALKNSVSKNILIEQYIRGIELDAIYTMINGEISLSLLNEKHPCKEYPQLCNLALTPTKYKSAFKKDVDPYIRKFLKGIHADNGVCFFQMIANDDHIYVFEMGYRLNGGNDWRIISRVNGINFMDMLIHYSMTGEMGDDLRKDNCEFDKYFCTLVTYCHGGTIGKIDYSKLDGMPGIDEINCLKKAGMHILENGTTQHNCGRIIMHGETKRDIVDLIHQIYDNIEIKDLNGADMMFQPFDSSALVL